MNNLPWDGPNHDIMADIKAFMRWAEADYDARLSRPMNFLVFYPDKDPEHVTYFPYTGVRHVKKIQEAGEQGDDASLPGVTEE